MTSRGLVFNIQRYSLHDGEGIRTTVFFKGCPLRCLWCSNPESLSVEQEIAFSKDNCIRCGICAAECKSGAKSLEGYDPSKCTGCWSCVRECPTGAMELIGKWMTVDEIMQELLADMQFFRKSGGGVTFSGGEVLLQDAFAEKLGERIKHYGLHLAVETCGNVSWQKAERVFRLCDQILYDFKYMDDRLHQQYTGVSNRLILENAAKAAGLGKHMVVRVPLIGGVNDNKENILATGMFMAENGLNEIHFLPYHRLGESKYQKINMDYSFIASTPSREKMDYLKSLLEKWKISVRIGGT